MKNLTFGTGVAVLAAFVSFGFGLAADSAPASNAAALLEVRAISNIYPDVTPPPALN